MRNVTGQAVTGEDLYGRDYELARLWEKLEQGEHILMLAPRRVGKTSLMQELRRAPRKNWDVIYIDVEDGDSPADCMAAILAALAADPQYQSHFKSFPFSNAVQDVLGRLSAVNVGTLRVELKGAMGREWEQAADQLQARLTSLPDAGRHLLIILDELPFLLSCLLRAEDGKRDAELLLSRLRHWRQAPELRGRVHTLVGGSIGLEGVLRRAHLSGSINDLVPFRLDSWDRATATEFLKRLEGDPDFRLDDGSITQILDLLHDPVPYHVQLFFGALCDACRGEASRISPEVIERCFAERLTGASGAAHLDHYAARLARAFDEDEHETARDILNRVCRRKDGAVLAVFEDLIQRSEQTFLSVLRDLEADGYLDRGTDRLRFRSNLLREWWRKHHGGVAP